MKCDLRQICANDFIFRFSAPLSMLVREASFAVVGARLVVLWLYFDLALRWFVLIWAPILVAIEGGLPAIQACDCFYCLCGSPLNHPLCEVRFLWDSCLHFADCLFEGERL